jgi:hypothetical protein
MKCAGTQQEAPRRGALLSLPSPPEPSASPAPTANHAGTGHGTGVRLCSTKHRPAVLVEREAFFLQKSVACIREQRLNCVRLDTRFCVPEKRVRLFLIAGAIVRVAVGSAVAR